MILFITMLMTCFNFVAMPASAAQKTLKTENGFLFMEIEKLDFAMSNFADSDKQTYFSGKNAVKPVVDNRVNPPPWPVSVPADSLPFVFRLRRQRRAGGEAPAHPCRKGIYRRL